MFTHSNSSNTELPIFGEFLNYDKMKIKCLYFRKIKLEAESKLTQLNMIREFLTCLNHLKEDEISRIQRESCVIQADINRLNSKIEVLN